MYNNLICNVSHSNIHVEQQIIEDKPSGFVKPVHTGDTNIILLSLLSLLDI